jgi:hypothetical protein
VLRRQQLRSEPHLRGRHLRVRRRRPALLRRQLVQPGRGLLDGHVRSVRRQQPTLLRERLLPGDARLHDARAHLPAVRGLRQLRRLGPGLLRAREHLRGRLRLPDQHVQCLRREQPTVLRHELQREPHLRVGDLPLRRRGSALLQRHHV